MNLAENIRLAFESLRVNRMRAFLTMLGIIIGISAVITITTSEVPCRRLSPPPCGRWAAPICSPPM